MASGKVDAIDINSGAMARVGMDALMTAGALEARGIETIPHLTTRDYNIIGLQAMLLGAWTVGGVRNVLAITGDPPSVGDYPEASGVYEVDSVGLVKILHRLNQGTDWAGKTLGGATNFAIGVAVNPVADDLDAEIERFHAKIEAGAHYAMTQPIFDPEHWYSFVKSSASKPPIPVMIGIWPLNSYKQALRLNNEVPGIVIPEAGSEIDGSRRRQRPRARLRGRPRNAAMVTHRTRRRVLDPSIQTLRGNSRHPLSRRVKSRQLKVERKREGADSRGVMSELQFSWETTGRRS